jgi:hypothetical protein
MKADVEEAKKLPWITKIMVNGENREEFLKKAALYTVF